MTYELLPEMITIVSSSDTLLVSDFTAHRLLVPRTILWQRDGLFRLVPRSVVRNAIHNYQVWSAFPGEKYIKGTIRWEQGVDVDPKIARILLSEQGD